MTLIKCFKIIGGEEMSEKNLNKLKEELTNFTHRTWTISSLAKILSNSLEYGSNMRKIDTIYPANLLDEMLEKQKYKISSIKKNLFGI